MIVDVHAHSVPAAVGEHLRNILGNVPVSPHAALVPAGTPMDDSDDDIAVRLHMMEAAEVGTQVLSLPPVPPPSDEQDAVRMAQLANDAHANVCATHPSRFKAYVQLPLPYADAALRELDRAFGQAPMAGVMLLASYGTTSMADPAFDTLFAALNERGATVLLHPSVGGLCSPLVNDYQLAAPVATALEDTLVVCQLLRRQTPLRYPNVKLIVPHLGGMLPIYLERLDNQLARMTPELTERPSAVIRRFWFDTVVHGSAVALRAACEAFGADRIVPGSDYPAMEWFGGYASSFEFISKSDLPAEVVEQILHRNAQALFS